MSEVITIDEPFPVDISYGSTSNPTYNTDVVTVTSGVETRNQNWTQARHSYNAAFGIRDQIYLNKLIEFFHTAKGKLQPFLYKDWSDYNSLNKDAVAGDTITMTDQVIKVGDPTTVGQTFYQLVKNYQYGIATTRVINKPVEGTIVVAIDGIAEGFTIDYDTGIIGINSGTLEIGQILTAGYEFWVPCRFDTDTLSVNLEMYQHGSVDVPLVEVRV